MGIPLTARMPIPFTPPSLLKRNLQLVSEAKTPIDIIVRVPTMYERDSFSATLVRGGVVHYSQKQIRDLMLAGVNFLYPDDRFEQIVGELEQLWQAGDAAKACAEKRDARFAELIEQQAERIKRDPNAKPLTEEQIGEELLKITPDVVLPESTRVRITAIQQDVSSRYEPMQKAFADLAEQDIRRSWVCVETYVINWHGLEHTPDGNGRGGLMRPEAEYLREQIGVDAFEQLSDFIFAMHTIDGDEEKNLASLIENTSAPIGSSLAESMATSEAGNLTVEPTTQTPEEGSPTMTDTLSSASNSSGTTTDASPSILTAQP